MLGIVIPGTEINVYGQSVQYNLSDVSAGFYYVIISIEGAHSTILIDKI